MSVVFRDCVCSPLAGITISAPDGAIIGVIGDDGSGKQELLKLAAGALQPDSGDVSASVPRRYHGPFDPPEAGDARTLALYHTLAAKDALARGAAVIAMEQVRRRGGVVLVVSHDLDFVNNLADEVWWIDGGAIEAKGDPGEVIDLYRHHVADEVQRLAAGRQIALPPSMRAGDGRAELLSIETLDAEGQVTAVWRSGGAAGIRVTVRFRAAVEAPVVGIMIRTRIGFEVYGTNSELENVAIGACRAGEEIRVTYRFECHLCPGEYTVTAASHDTNGVWHDWVQDGAAVSVADHRYTAGVACLRAEVEIDRG